MPGRWAYRVLSTGELGIVARTGHDSTAPIVGVMVRFLSAHT